MRSSSGKLAKIWSGGYTYARFGSGKIHKMGRGGGAGSPTVIGEDVKIPTYKPLTNHKRSSVRSHTLAPTTICGLSHSLCWRPLTDLGHISSVTYVCHPLWFVCGHRKGILTSPLTYIHRLSSPPGVVPPPPPPLPCEPLSVVKDTRVY